MGVAIHKSPVYDPSCCKLSKMHSHVQSRLFMSGGHSHVHAPSIIVCILCTLLHSTVQSTIVQYLYFKPRLCSDITGSFFQEGRQNWIQQGTRTCRVWVQLQLALCLLHGVAKSWKRLSTWAHMRTLRTLACCWKSFSSAVSPLLSSCKWLCLPVRSLSASSCMPAVALHFVFVFYVLFLWKVL